MNLLISSQMDLRGMLGSLMQFFLCIGFLLSYVVGPYTSYLTLILCSAGIPILCILVFSWMPESPYYLLSKDRKEEALNSLQWLRGYPEPLTMQNEIADIHVSIWCSHYPIHCSIPSAQLTMCSYAGCSDRSET